MRSDINLDFTLSGFLEFSAGTEMAQLICGGCHTLLMYVGGASRVQCSCCHTVNLASQGKQVFVTKTFYLNEFNLLLMEGN